jgi:Holliday junction resolvasome RuvABC endonuclease subunit
LRSPVKGKSARKPELRVLGIDPGFASLGVCVLEKRHGDPRVHLIHGHILKTAKKAKKKANMELRVAADDARRCREIWRYVNDMIETYKPTVMAIEWYAPYKASGSAWKSVLGVGLCYALAQQHNLVTFPNLPQDIKSAFSLKKGASKDEIGYAVCERIDGLRERLEPIAEKQREHLSDAAAHAYLAFAQAAELRQMLGG